jgi:hypothetical protein
MVFLSMQRRDLSHSTHFNFEQLNSELAVLAVKVSPLPRFVKLQPTCHEW